MGTKIKCFLLLPTEEGEVSFRRFVFSKEGAPCPCPSGYHDAEVVVGKCRFEPNSSVPDLVGYSEEPDRTDPRWPKKCSCGYEFREDDQWQRNVRRLHDRDDGGPQTTIRKAPPGAMWYADWWSDKGPDGRCLAVKTPAGEWMVDGPSTNGKGWTRTGTPPNVTARPSIGIGKKDGGWVYHGFLTDGVLEEC